MNLPRTLGELRKSAFSEQRLRARKVKDELRDNLIAKLRSGETIFPGIIGYDDTVVPQLVNAIIQVESEYNPHAVSRKGALGLMQLLPSTAELLGVRNAFDPKQNIEGGVTHLKNLLEHFGGDVPLSLAAYNSGARAVERSGGIPSIPETKQYVKKVWNLYQPGTPFAAAKWGSPASSPIYRYVDTNGVVHFTNVE